MITRELLNDPVRTFPPEAWKTTRPTPRVVALRDRLLHIKRQVDLERARITTWSYQHTEGEPMPIRRAKMLLDIVRQMNIAIYPGELIVGNRSLHPRMGVIAPESAVEWIDHELDILATRPQDQFTIDPAQITELRETIFPYWRGRTLEDVISGRIPDDVRIAVRGKAFSLNQTDHAQGHILPDVPAWLTLGIEGLVNKVMDARRNPEVQTAEQQVFYDSCLIALQAARELAVRYAQLAAQLEKDETDPQRKEELSKISLICNNLSSQPAKTFWEMLQSTWFLFVLLQIESNASSFSPGRLDQYGLSYLLQDLDKGLLTLTEAQELLECFWLKFNEIVLLRSSTSAKYFAGFPIGFNLMIGGQCAPGVDATNPLSYMCLRAHADIGLTQPNLSIRIHSRSPQSFLRAASLVISRGGGIPQVFNDEVIIPGQIRRGVTISDAYDYAAVGCVELSIPGKALGWSDASMFNMVRILELTLFGGKDPTQGDQIGLSTPCLDQVKHFSDLEDIYLQQLAHFVQLMVKGCNIVDQAHAEVLPSPFLSVTIQGCLEKGKDVTAGGALYNFSGVQGVQIANMADSLEAIRTAVFRLEWISAGDMLKVLQNNFQGSENLRQRLINQVPKMGNDVDEVDEHAKKWAEHFCNLVTQYPTIRGGIYQPGFYTVSAHVPMGENVGAMPDGRLAGQPLADGGLSPMSGCDRHGPTAVLRSLSKIDLSLATNGTLLNMKMLPSFFETQDALDKFIALLRGFCILKIPHVQFNVIASQTLRDAQEHPENYRGLVIRVAGYSAYFVELDKSLQNEIIARTSYHTL
ncbi:MAG TPA: glycyl radical protein [Anaerolineaceae bacterium]